VTYPARRAEILATRKDLVAEMSASVATLDDLLAAASEVVGTVVASSPDLARLTQQIEALRGYAAALRELSG
jgi:ABC-type transporter Mla subunit MlaD